MTQATILDHSEVDIGLRVQPHLTGFFYILLRERAFTRKALESGLSFRSGSQTFTFTHGYGGPKSANQKAEHKIRFGKRKAQASAFRNVLGSLLQLVYPENRILSNAETPKRAADAGFPYAAPLPHGDVQTYLPGERTSRASLTE